MSVSKYSKNVNTLVRIPFSSSASEVCSGTVADVSSPSVLTPNEADLGVHTDGHWTGELGAQIGTSFGGTEEEKITMKINGNLIENGFIRYGDVDFPDTYKHLPFDVRHFARMATYQVTLFDVQPPWVRELNAGPTIV